MNSGGFCRRLTVLILALGLSACVSTEIRPEQCPEGTLKLEGCPPESAIDDPQVARLYESRTYREAWDVELDPIEYGSSAKIPINRARAKFIGSTDEDGLASLAAKLHLIENAEHTIDMVYYIFADDLVGLAILGALCDAVQRGVDIRIMVDSLGSISLDKKYLRALESCALDAGFMRAESGETTIYRARVQPVIFNAVSKVFVKINRRSHDKLIVVDGWVPDKAAVMTGGRNISLAYYGILPDGSHNPDTYRDAEIFLRGGASEGETRESVGSVSEIYYTLLFLFKNNKRLAMSTLRNPRSAYADERQLFADSLAALKALPRLAEQMQKMPKYVAEDFHVTDVRLAHDLTNLTNKKVVYNAVENAELNPNSIARVFQAIQGDFENVQIVSPYMFAALYKDKDGNVVLDEARNLLQWLDEHPDSKVTILTNSALTSDNVFTQAVIDMDLAPRLFLSEDYWQAWLEKPDDGEFNPDLVESGDWARMISHPQLRFYETGRIDDVSLGGDQDYSKLHAKYVVKDDFGFIGTTNFDYRSRLFNNEMGFFFRGKEIADDVRANTEYLIGLSYEWGSPEWLQMRKQLMALKGQKAWMTRRQRTIYKTLRNTGLQWFF